MTLLCTFQTVAVHHLTMVACAAKQIRTTAERCVYVTEKLWYDTAANPLATAVQWHNLCVSHGPELLARMDEQGLYVFPTHHLEWERNKAKLLECNRQPNHPVAKIKAVNGRHAQKADSNKAGGLLPLLYLSRDSKVMLVVNLKAGLYNGAVGTVVDIVYKQGCRPTDNPTPLPDVVFVRFPGYKGPP